MPSCYLHCKYSLTVQCNKAKKQDGMDYLSSQGKFFSLLSQCLHCLVVIWCIIQYICNAASRVSRDRRDGKEMDSGA